MIGFLFKDPNPNDSMDIDTESDFVSAPTVSFTLAESSVPIAAGTPSQNPMGASAVDAFMLEETELLDRHGQPHTWRGRPNYIQDPFNSQRTLRVLSSDAQSGESTISAKIVSDLGTLDTSGDPAGGNNSARTLSRKSSSKVPGG